MEIQKINGRPYTQKEVSFIYLSHLDPEQHNNVKEPLRTNVEASLPPIPIKYRVPGLVTVITHLMSTIPANEAYVNVAQDICRRCSDESNGAVILAANFRGGKPYGTDNRNPDTHNSSRNPRFSRSQGRPPPNKTSFKGSCFGCSRDGHHATECYFLMKVEQCMAYLKQNQKAGQKKATKYRQQSSDNYRSCGAKIAHLQDENFLHYPDADLDNFLDYLDDAILNEADEMFIK